MAIINAALHVPADIASGLARGIYERVGGVVRKANSKEVVAWLRETGNVNEAVRVGTSLLPQVAAASSVLNLAVSTMGFAVVLKRLNLVEKQLQQAQKTLNMIDYKVDLSFYANFRAALDLAMNAFTMHNTENRKMSAMQAINRFLEAEHHYIKLADTEIDNGSQIADEYLSTLCLAYVTEARCYLELEEVDTAHRRLQDGVDVLRSRYEKYVNTLLTSNPAAYLHPSLKEQVGLKQLTKIYQWLELGVTENDVFEMQRENLFDLAQNPDVWVKSLPQAIVLPKEDTSKLSNALSGLAKQSKKIIGNLPANSKILEAMSQFSEANPYERLPAAMELAEKIVEDDNRLTMYTSEVETIHDLGISFQEWQQLAPVSMSDENEINLMYITISQ